MELMRINSWDEYQSIISQVKSKYSSCTILYRGQANAKWLLESTLERYRPSSWTVRSYSELSLRCAYQIESFTEKKWNLDHISKTEVEMDSHSYNIPIPYYRFWVYLRHHKFPSPLLDWTMSPYIAAFFAFEEDIRKKEAEIKEAAIFAYIEYPCGMKIWQEGPKIETLKPEVGTDKRHFLQQSSYSVCTNYKNGSHQYVCHEEIFRHGKPNQDALIKICIPRTERKKILSYLNEVNINHWSLFQTDEALMQTLAFREIDSRGL